METSRRDLYWTIVLAAVILIAIITFWLGGKGSEMVSYISFASALVSIVLALVAIFYSFVQNVNSQQNIGEMKTLVSEASRIMTEKAGTLVDVAEQLRQAPATKSTTTTSSEDEAYPSVRFSLVVTSDLTRLFAYFLVRSNISGRLLPIGQCVDIVKPLVKMPATELRSHLYGVLFGMTCCLKIQLNDEQTSVQLLSMPDKFKEHLEGQVASLKRRNPDSAKCLVQIDDIS